MVSGAARRLVILDAIACPSTDPQSLIGVVLCSKISAHAHCPIPNTQLFGISTIATWICWTNSLMMMLQKELSFSSSKVASSSGTGVCRFIVLWKKYHFQVAKYYSKVLGGFSGFCFSGCPDGKNETIFLYKHLQKKYLATSGIFRNETFIDK